jgi:hypothetical protein
MHVYCVWCRFVWSQNEGVQAVPTLHVCVVSFRKDAGPSLWSSILFVLFGPPNPPKETKGRKIRRIYVKFFQEYF